MKGKILLTRYPFDDFTAFKIRPVLCLSNPVSRFKHIVVAFITSQLPEKLEKTDYLISENGKSFSNTGLKITSVIRLHRLLTIPYEYAVAELGFISKENQSEIFSILSEFLMQE